MLSLFPKKISMSANECLSSLSGSLFWDIDKNLLDLDTCPGQIIQRVLEYGTLNDWKQILRYYGLDKIVNESRSLRSLDPKALSFICCISGIPKENFRCYHSQQLNRAHWSY